MDILINIEDPVKTALLPLQPGLRTLDVYAGQLDVGKAEVIAQFPCIYILTRGMTVDTENDLAFTDVDIQLIIGDRNLRGPTAAQRGDGTSPGVYALMQSAYDILHGQRLHDGLAPLYLTAAAPWIYRPRDGLCVWTQTYKIKGNI